MQEIQNFIELFIKDLEYKTINTMFAKLKQGKMLRSKLILNIAQKNDRTYKLCAIVELIHLASLLHDDVIDEARLRRGAKSINAEFGAKNAIMLGDILYAKAFYELNFLGLDYAKIISKAVCALAKGELMDIELSKAFNADEQNYIQMIEYKTASLLSASASCAALLEGFDAKAFSIFGTKLGIAFQIVDDILDINSDENKLGKPAMSDFKEGKCTLAYIYLYKNSDTKTQFWLKNLYKKDLKTEELNLLKQRLKPFIAQSLEEAKKYINSGLLAIKAYENQALKDIVLKMVNREF